ncbi:MAG TPA: rod shape-determining protein MreD [Candidatus Omnitrophota bacterium]|nr:rod shape-determining protein MreD [Candidatus Omnitrophota bacterium]HQL40739.1 rod shape-determining protein MreD [Candidatus Omnitrophota bacterium]
MIKKTLWILISCYLLFLIEIGVFHVFSFWVKPNFLILFVIFINLFWGSRYGLWAAVAAGLLKDSLLVGVFGVNIFSFIISSYIVLLLKKYIFQIDALYLKIALAFFLSALNVSILYIVAAFFASGGFRDIAWFLAIPEIITTTAIGPYAFLFFKKCALKVSK